MKTNIFKKTAGIILCGGQSTRMGEDKASLIYQGTSLFEHAHSLFLTAGISSVYYSSNKPYGDQGLAQIKDITPERGPLGGLYASLEMLGDQYSHLLLMPIDMPLLKPELIKQLNQAKTESELVSFEGFLFPFQIATTASTKEKVRLLLSKNDQRAASIKGLFSCCSCHALPLEANDSALLANVNTPAEWKGIASS